MSSHSFELSPEINTVDSAVGSERKPPLILDLSRQSDESYSIPVKVSDIPLLMSKPHLFVPGFVEEKLVYGEPHPSDKNYPNIRGTVPIENGRREIAVIDLPKVETPGFIMRAISSLKRRDPNERIVYANVTNVDKQFDSHPFQLDLDPSLPR